MRELFHGRKRKLGVVTLLMACVLSAWWVTSYSQMEEAYFSFGIHMQLFRSFEGEILTMEDPPWDLIYDDGSGLRRAHFVSIPKNQACRMAINDDAMIRIPYWSIALPLTAISASLLLSKPRLATLRVSSPAH